MQLGQGTPGLSQYVLHDNNPFCTVCLLCWPIIMPPFGSKSSPRPKPEISNDRKNRVSPFAEPHETGVIDER